MHRVAILTKKKKSMKKKSSAKLIELKESYDLCDIWRVRNMESRQFNFTQIPSRISNYDRDTDSYFN